MDDQGQLIRFLKSVNEDVKDVIHSNGLAEDSDLNEAWRAVLQRDELESMVNEIRTGRFNGGLKGAGLSGPELTYKLNRVELAREHFSNAKSLEDSIPLGVPKWGRRLLQRIDLILNSLFSVLGVGEAFLEFKASLELDLEEREVR